MRRALLALALAGCDTGFEDPEIVVDLRHLAAVAEPPEVVLPFDPSDPRAPAPEAFGEVEVCALVADPGASRRLAWQMDVCPPSGDGRA